MSEVVIELKEDGAYLSNKCPKCPYGRLNRVKEQFDSKFNPDRRKKLRCNMCGVVAYY